jgi:hypothetical protein
LIDESDTAPEDPLKAADQELTDIYDTVFARDNLKARVKTVAEKYQDTCGHRAEFWYMLAVGIELANTQVFGRDYNVYLTRALTLTLPAHQHTLHCEYYTRLKKGIERRYNASDRELIIEHRGKYWAPLMRVNKILGQLGVKQSVDAH